MYQNIELANRYIQEKKETADANSHITKNFCKGSPSKTQIARVPPLDHTITRLKKTGDISVVHYHQFESFKTFLTHSYCKQQLLSILIAYRIRSILTLSI